MKKLKLGILGYGGMGNWHARNAENTEGIEMVSVHDIDPQRLDDARKLGYKAYERRSDFLTDEDINFVLIATPNHVHKEFAIEALRAGKNVICEKPVTLSVSELDEIIKVSEETGMIFTVHQNRRLDRDYLVMRQAVEQKKIGKVYSIESRVYGNNGKIYGWRQKKEFGGGMLLDWGVHLIDHFTYMYPDDKVVSVYTQLFSIVNNEVDDLFKVDMRLESGLSIHVQVGTFGLIPQPRFIAHGDLGTMTVHDFSGEKGQIKVLKHRLDDMGRVILDTPAGPTRTMAPQPEECFMEDKLPAVTDGRGRFYENLIAVINDKAELFVNPASVRRTMQVIEAAFESAEKNEVIKTNI